MWKAVFREGETFGNGLAGLQREGILRFDVYVSGGTVISAFPSIGHIEIDGTVQASSAPGPLLWFRRMSFQMGTKDSNETCGADVQFYGLGFGDTVLVKITSRDAFQLVSKWQPTLSL